MARSWIVPLLSWAALLAGSAELLAQSVPSGFTAPQRQGGAVSDGTAMAIAPDGRIFVAQQGGGIRVIKNGALLAAPFDVLAVAHLTESGLLGIALDPDFATNGGVYVFYRPNGIDGTRVSRLVAAGDVRDASRPEQILFEISTVGVSPFTHAGGGMQFGSDGKLYVAVGDGEEPLLAQNPASLQGKMLRLNPDGSIPSDNPTVFQGTAATLPAPSAVWAIGLRNPHTLAMQPGSGRLFINDVGHDDWEEINEGFRGRNYGWEGGPTDGRRNSPSFTDSLFEYARQGTVPAGNVITGGAFYNPATVAFPSSYVGKYFFGDVGHGDFIALLDPGTGLAELFITNAGAPVDIDVGPDGALYYLSRGANPGVYRVSYNAVAAQSIKASVTTLTVDEGATASFDVRLGVNPGATPVTIAVANTIGDATVTASPAVLTFTSADWNIGHPVTVAAAQDADLSDDGATVTLSSPGLVSVPVVVTARDDDPAASVPRVDIALPLNGQLVTGANAEFYGHATGTTTEGRFYVDGALSYTDPNVVGHYHHGGGHASWDTTKLPNGPHVLQLRVSDGTNVGVAEVTVIVSNRPGGGGIVAGSGNVASGGGRGGNAGCGLVGAEAFLILGVLELSRRRRRAGPRGTPGSPGPTASLG